MEPPGALGNPRGGGRRSRRRKVMISYFSGGGVSSSSWPPWPNMNTAGHSPNSELVSPRCLSYCTYGPDVAERFICSIVP